MITLIKKLFNGITNDGFDTIVAFYRIIGIAFLGYYKSESKIKLIVIVLYCIAIYLLGLYNSIRDILYFGYFKNSGSKLGAKIFYLMYIYFTFVVIFNSILLCFCGWKMRKLIDKLRTMVTDINSKSINYYQRQYNCSQYSNIKLWKLKLIISFVLLIYITQRIICLSSFYLQKLSEHQSLTQLLIIIIKLIGAIYFELLQYTTEFILFYFIIYTILIIKQIKNIITTNKLINSLNDIEWFKKKMNEIQNIVLLINNLFSPMLLLMISAEFLSIAFNVYYAFIVNDYLIMYITYSLPFIFNLCINCCSADVLHSEVINLI